MKRKLQLKSILLMLISLIFFSGSVLGQQYRNGIRQGVVRVKFKPQISATLNSVQPTSVNGVLHTGIQAFDKVNSQLSAVKMKRVFPYSPRHEAKHKKYGLDLWYEVSYTSGTDPKEAVAGYANLDEVSLAEPIRQKSFVNGEVTYAPTAANGEEPFDDTYLADQWHYNNKGTLGTSVEGGDINLFKAWEIEAGKPNVVVCIVDGGIDVDHEDLAANMWINEAEMNGEEGVDDDGNGYVDDIHGYNFVSNIGAISAHNHGTHVAGTVAAVNNNNTGVAGVAGGSGNNDGIRLMSSQIFSVNGGGGDPAAAIVYGADNGAVISQNSWGYTSPGAVEQSILDAIDYFVAEAGDFTGSPMKGGVVIFAAGNSDAEGDYYPACYESAIAVSALGPDLKRASYSNYGTWVDIAAPGGEEYYGKNHGVLSTMPDDKYGYMQGTSMACPHVSGVAALVVSKFGGSTFTNEDLKVHILTGTHDIDELNPDYAGKLGVGYLDAAWALDTNEEIAPNAVADLNLIGIAQDFANISWTVPADDDDGKPVSFEVLYSTEDITNDNADLADKVSLAIPRNDNVGTVKELDVQELKPETTYYIAIRSIDRWGNVSNISNVVSGTTNAGPAINTDLTVIDFAIDATVSTSAEGLFTILNEAEGVLKWEGFIRHKKPSLSYNSTGLNYPEITTASSSKKLGRKEALISREQKDDKISVSSVEPMADEEEEIYYGAGWGMVIGDEDTNLTNSSATRYHVDKAEGFNLTNVESYLNHTPGTGPMIMEIYQGEQMHEKNLVLAQEVTSWVADPYWHNIDLDEQLFFEQGTTFWIVFHVPAGNLYPLGMEMEWKPEYSDNCFMSFDLGKTWDPLATLLQDDRYVWSTAAISKNRSLGNYITLNPSSGVVEGNKSQEVELSLDASALINGTYKANVVLESNDGDDKYFRLPVNLTVQGQAPKLVHESVIDFGSVFFGHNKEITFTIRNTGYGNFNVSNAVSLDDQFEIVKKPSKIAARDEEQMTILYTPQDAGTHNGGIEMTDRQGRVHVINLYGNAAAPSEISISPAEQQLADMGVNETASTSFTITNTGDYPLEYVIPAFAQDVELDGMDEIHKFGYTLESNVNGDTTAVFSWDDISNSGVDVTTQLARTDYAYRFLDVDLGFDFPFYGQKMNTIKLTRAGLLSFSDEGGLANCGPTEMRSGCVPEGFISAFSMKFDLNRSGSVKYKREPGKFIVEYKDVMLDYEWNVNAKASFQFVLFYNGDIEIRYKDVENLSSYNLKSAFVAIGDPELKDGLLVHGSKGDWTFKDGGLHNNETMFRLKAPGESLITSVSEPNGIIRVGESKTIDVEVSTEGLYESAMYQRLSVVSNDPFHNPAAFTLKVNVNSGGVSDLKMDKTEVDLGQVFQGGVSRDVIILSNEGTKDIEITAINWSNDKFIVEGSAPVLLKPKSTYYAPIEINTSEKGVFDDVLVIETNEGNTFEAQLHADVIPAPAISVDVTPITETVNAGEMITRNITVTNNGESALEIVPAGNDWLYLSQPETMGTELPEFSYYSQTNNDADGPGYNWNDIRKEGVHFHSETWVEDGEPVLWQAVALPYEITYYNQPTDSIWISWQGLISMSKPKIDNTMLWPAPIPTADEPNNVICPYYAQQNTDIQSFGEEAGVFYQFYDDRIVVMWAECYDGFGMGDNYSFQAILYKNGNIKFQYKTGMMSMTSFGAIGLENADGTDGVQLAYMQNFIKDGLAVSFTPAEKEIVPAGESKQFTVALDANLLNKGVYEGNFRFFNNTPQNEEVKVPVTLTVNGEAAMVANTEACEFGEVMAYTVDGDYGPEAKSYIQDFAIENTGRDVVTFSNIAMMDGSEAVAEMFYYDPFLGFGYWQAINTWNLPSLAPGETVKLRMRIFPSGTNPELSDELVFSGNLPNGDFKLPVHAMVSLPPAIVVDQEPISVLANTVDHQEVRTVTIDNTNGQSALNYNLGINFQREGEVENAEAASVETFVSAPLVSLGNMNSDISANNIQSLADDTYNAVLEYDTLSVPVNALGLGEATPFMTGTAFQAPEIGFNLTHVKTCYYYGEVLDSKITVEIRAGGTNVADAKVLTRESFDVNVETPENYGYFTFELAENQIFYPGETFYVVFEYALGVGMPQAIADGVEDVAGRFMYSDGSAWGDLQAAGFTGNGWMVKAMEKEHKSKSWVSIDGATEGSVPVGESVTVDLKFLAADAQEANNAAALIISSNDPYNPESSVDLHLRINQGPQFDQLAELTVNENETLNFVVIAQDLEGDACSYALAEAYDFVQMSAQNDTISFVYTPDFESAGVKTFTLIGEDVYGNATNNEITVEVVNVNRAPELIGSIDAREYYEDEEFDYIDLMPIFTDPDNEVLSYRVTVDNPIVTIFSSEDEIAIRPLEVGDAVVTVVATDSEGLTAETSFSVKIGTVTGIEDIEGSGTTKVYPVPTTGPLNIVLGNEIEGEVNISIINLTGTSQFQTTVNKGRGSYTETLDISNLPSGIYLVNIRTSDEVIVKKVIKK